MSTFKLNQALKLGYGVGQLSDGAKQAAFNSFLFFYYNQVLGLPGTLAGTAALLSLLFDGITDPMIGQLSDNSRSRWGRRHPFMLASAIPFAGAMYALFSPPENLGETSLFGWMLFWAMTVRFFHTLFYIPHLSLGVELERDYYKRTSLISYRVLFAFLGSLITSVGGFALFFSPSIEFPNGLLNPLNYPSFGFCVGAVATFAMLLSIHTTRGTIPYLHIPATRPRNRPAVWGFITVLETLRLPSFRGLFVAVLIFTTISGSNLTLGVYVATYIYQFSPEQIAIVTFSPVIGMLFGPKVAITVSNRFDKRKTLASVITIGANIAVFPLVLYLLGGYQYLHPVAGLALVFLCMGISFGFFMSYQILFDSMLSDTVDEHELVTGYREEGLFFAARALAQKASFGLGSFLSGIALDIIQFPRGADPTAVPQHILIGLALVGGPISLAIYLSTIIASNKYRLTERQHTEIMRQIAARRQFENGFEV